jgi:hypothetical protein
MVKEKTCPQCNAIFSCSTEKCWCSLLPNIITLPKTGECLCPSCLETMIQEKINTSEKN